MSCRSLFTRLTQVYREHADASEKYQNGRRKHFKLKVYSFTFLTWCLVWLNLFIAGQSWRCGQAGQGKDAHVLSQHRFHSPYWSVHRCSEIHWLFLMFDIFRCKEIDQLRIERENTRKTIGELSDELLQAFAQCKAHDANQASSTWHNIQSVCAELFWMQLFLMPF